jgi:hypothetical protein
MNILVTGGFGFVGRSAPGSSPSTGVKLLK